MRVLVVGSGGREHALGWALARSPSIDEVHASPGNVGLKSLGCCHGIAADDIAGLTRLTARLKVDFVVVGPELPLREGLADALRSQGIPVLGPGKEAARIEWSKAFSKELMASVGVPTAPFQVFADPGKAVSFIESRQGPIVVKADGLAAGKGVRVCSNSAEARSAVEDFMVHGAMGTAGRTVLLEERLEGREVTVQALVDGEQVLLLPPSCDHKPLYDGDEGPNTGGMGAYAPTHLLDQKRLEEVRASILVPVARELASRGIAYRGVLYAGLMLTRDGPMVLEFNCRFGDPEAQVILPLLEGDLGELLHACAQGALQRVRPRWREGFCVCVVLTSRGYPLSPEKGFPIEGLETVSGEPGVVLFHAGTAEREGRIVTAGGRVLGVTAHAATLSQARERAYGAASRLEFAGAHFRRDIGGREAMP